MTRASETYDGDDHIRKKPPSLAFWAQLRVLAAGLRLTRERWTLVTLGAAIFVVILLTAAAQVALNVWNNPFYNAIANRDVRSFIHQLSVFFGIAGSLLVLNVVQMWLSLMAQLKLREGLMHDLLTQWLTPMRAFRLAHVSDFGVNPDQRLHEDTRHLAELSVTLAMGLLQASVLIAVFVVILWHLSGSVSFMLAAHLVKIPGYMVWAAIAYALIGSLASFRVGYALIHFNADRYAREAELRYALVRVSQKIGTISLLRGEGNERRGLDAILNDVLAAMRKLVTATTRLTWVTAGYGWLTQVVPILVAAPAYFEGRISFGGLMMAVGAFNQVQSSLRWFVDNFTAIADWRATLVRVADFRNAVIRVDDTHKAVERIAVEHGPPGCLRLEDLCILAPQGRLRLTDESVAIQAGERVQIAGDADTVLFRALAGLWPWGTGRIVLPATEPFMHVARRPYVRAGTLREALAYPADPNRFQDDAFKASLEAVGLGDLVERLDDHARWDEELGDQDAQRLAFARLPLQHPDWIIIDHALETLDDAQRDRIIAMLQSSHKAATIINVGRLDESGFFSRTIGLETVAGDPLPAAI